MTEQAACPTYPPDQIVGEFNDERAAAFEDTYPLLRGIGYGLTAATLLARFSHQ
jgi:hypothetical protein